MDYENLLDRARSKLPERVLKRERFETPRLNVHGEGNKTILENFKEVCDILRRDPQQVLRYIVGVVGTKGSMEASRAILAGVFPDEAVNKGIANYVKDFVMCPGCNKPDTHILKDGRINYLKCDACGAKHVCKIV